MGFMVSKENANKRNKEIEDALNEQKRTNGSIFKLLLLGAAESGKSTIVKQMRILHANGFKEDEMKQHQAIVIQNVIENIAAIIRAMEALMISFEDPQRQGDAALILKAEEEFLTKKFLTPEEWQSIKLLWADAGIQACFDRSNEYQLGESTKYFCDQLDRISSSDFIPTCDDILLARISTLGIVEIAFQFRNLTLRVIDVGGQRSQRKKWIHCFDGVNCLIFVASLSEYNQVLLEDASMMAPGDPMYPCMNRMHESLRLFETVCNCQWFRNTSTILFLNKKDLFEEKLNTFPLTLAFPDYKGSQEYGEAAAYIEDQFKRRGKTEDKELYVHHTCATDTTNIDFVTAASFDVMISKNIESTGWS